MNNRNFEIRKIFREHHNDQELLEYLSNYHENDIADILKTMTTEERKKSYRLLGLAKTAEIFAYFDEPEIYIEELSIESAANIISLMDADDAVDVLEKLDTEKRNRIVEKLDSHAATDVKMLLSYGEDEIASYMTTNYVCITEGLSVRQAMNELIRQAGTHDNIMTLYVVDEENRLTGAIDLKELITARQNDELDDIIIKSYPYVTEREKLEDCLERIMDYAEDSIPVLNDEKKLLGVITSEDMVEIVDQEMGEDYAKLAGLTAEEDLTETTVQSMKKRLPWLLVLLVLGMLVSSVVGIFEGVVAVVPIVICFQSLVLDMAGNVGTQSLAVTIRVLMDENVTGKEKLQLLGKEMKIGLYNGIFLGSIAFVMLGIYIHLSKGYGYMGAFAVSGCVGIALVAAMMVSSLVGTVIPMLFHKVKIDPAVASGPLITTVNDLVAVVTYYGLAYLVLIK